MWTVLSLFLLASGLPARLLSTSMTPSLGDAYQLVGVLFLYAFLQGAFDLFGGYLLPKEYGRTDEPLHTFLSGWFRGAALHGGLLFIFALALLSASRLGGFALALLLFLLFNLLLVWAQVPLARLIGDLRAAPVALKRDAEVLLRARHRYFTGGVTGFPGRARVVLPEAWQRDPGGAPFEALLKRKVALVQRGAYTRGLLLALVWNTAGFCLAYAAAGGTAHVAGLVSFSLWSTLWAFVGVLVLPTPSRIGVFTADRYALAEGVGSTLARAVERLERDQDDEPSRSKGVETVFHPIPSVERRVAALTGAASPPQAERWAPWHTARLALYLSWANLSWLSRAVHCNIGRPEVWVFLPSD